MSMYWSPQCGYSACCITLTFGPPYSQSGVLGTKGEKWVSKELTSPPRSFQRLAPPLLFILSFSLSLLYSAPACDWPDRDGNQPGPSVKASPPPLPSPNFLSFPSNTQQQSPTPCTSCLPDNGSLPHFQGGHTHHQRQTTPVCDADTETHTAFSCIQTANSF